MYSHSSAYQPVTGTDAYSHPLPGGSGALVIEIFLSPRRKRRSAAMPRSGACFVKKATSGYAGGHKELHLWIEKENLR